jgi:D-alanyl-D-alanine carboxypeptidase
MPPTIRRLFPVLGLLAAAPISAQSGRVALVASLDSIARSAIKDGRAAGISVGVVRGKDTLLFKGYGYADLEFDVPTPDRAIYEIGSVTKQFTSSSILLLAEQGKLSLDDELTKYLPSYPTQGNKLTIRRLMDHTSGIKGYTEMPDFGPFSMRKLPRDSLVARFSAAPFDFPPGDALVYNNSAYFLLGLVIEKVSGKTYADFVKENLFDRVGMADSRYCSENAIVKRRAHGYDAKPGGGLVQAGYLDQTWPYAAGSLCSTTGDLIRWTQALHSGKVLSAASYRELITPGTLNDGYPIRYAKGLTSVPVAGHRAIHHGGGINGFLSDLAWFPDDSAVIVVLINTAGPVSPTDVLTALAERLLGKVSPAKGTPYSGDLSQFVGSWKGVGRGSPLSLSTAVDSGALTMHAQGKVTPLRFVGNDTFEAGATRLGFIREAGQVKKLRVDAVSVVSILERAP